MSRTTATGSRKGFTLVELAVVIVIIGVLAAFGVPQFLKSVERSKAAESFNYLSALRAAQERFLAKNGYYYEGTADATGVWPPDTNSGDNLDITQTLPKYFTLGPIAQNHSTAGKPTWWCCLTRKDSSYGQYLVTFDQAGYAPSGTTADRGGAGESMSNIDPDVSPMGADTAVVVATTSTAT